MHTTVGTCSLCKGPVQLPKTWMGILPPVPTCGKCGAIKEESYGPVTTTVKPQPHVEETLDLAQFLRPKPVSVRELTLLIDDEQEIGVDVIARTAEAGKILLACRTWSKVYLDHDLGPGESGYDVLTWALEMEKLPLKVQLVTSNPSGRLRMTQALTSSKYVTKDGLIFTKYV